ncbi:D-alanine--D-alanine ligase [Sodalis-like symbiont of Bactericera trigonica]|nr:D-alanine--D-alanine ligase [Sodalis-like symbiont of Bactericera trigonica]
MAKIRVGVIFGGRSAEHEVSLQSAKNIVDAIDQELFDVVLLGIDKQGKWYLHDAANYLLHGDDPARIALTGSTREIALFPGRRQHPLMQADQPDTLFQLDVIFPIIHGTLGEDGSLQGLLRMANLPYVGSDVLGSAIPANQGSSVGVSRVTDRESFAQAIALAFCFDHKVLVETAIAGRELECAVLGNDEPEASLCGEIVLSDSFYSYHTKYIDEMGAQVVVPAAISQAVSDEIRHTALRAFIALNCAGMARVDVFLIPEGKVVVNEVNTLPGFTNISMYPKLWQASGLGYTDLITRLITLALERHRQDQTLASSLSLKGTTAT